MCLFRFMKEKSQTLEGFDDGSGEKLAAYMMGRWKNGMYIILPQPRVFVHGQKANRPWWFAGSPVELDDKNSQAKHPYANNFEYSRKYSSAKDVKCPFAAHIRKMRPRADLYVGANGDDDVTVETNTVNNSNVILRRSITFGPEFADGEEKLEKDKKPKRGIYFLCYQADLRNGFNLLVTRKFSPPLISQQTMLTNEFFFFF